MASETCTWLISYDISRDGNRVRAADLLSAVGDRLQRSVFLIRAERRETERLLIELRGTIDPRLDSIHAFRLCQSCQQEVVQLGQAALPDEDECWVVS